MGRRSPREAWNAPSFIARRAIKLGAGELPWQLTGAAAKAKVSAFLNQAKLL